MKVIPVPVMHVNGEIRLFLSLTRRRFSFHYETYSSEYHEMQHFVLVIFFRNDIRHTKFF